METSKAIHRIMVKYAERSHWFELHVADLSELKQALRYHGATELVIESRAVCPNPPYGVISYSDTILLDDLSGERFDLLSKEHKYNSDYGEFPVSYSVLIGLRGWASSWKGSTLNVTFATATRESVQKSAGTEFILHQRLRRNQESSQKSSGSGRSETKRGPDANNKR